jgi:hypothetical protein
MAPWQSYQGSRRLRLGERERAFRIVDLANGGDPARTIDADQGVLEDFNRADGRGMKEGPEEGLLANVLHGLSIFLFKEIRRRSP